MLSLILNTYPYVSMIIIIPTLFHPPGLHNLLDHSIQFHSAHRMVNANNLKPAAPLKTEIDMKTLGR